MTLIEEKMPDRASLTQEVEKLDCDNCFEEYLFYLKDKVHDFSISLTDVLRCLEFAEKEGAVPKLSSQWWLSVKRHYRDLEDYDEE